MAASCSLEKISDHLTCCICFDMFKVPKTLPCMHTFCETCLKDYVSVQLNKNVIMCPACRESVDIPKGGVSSMRTNFDLQNMVDYLERPTPKLSKSPEQPSRSSCLEAENKISSKCPLHKEYDVSRLCVTCDVWQCEVSLKQLYCALTDAGLMRTHPGHSVKSAKEASGIVIDQLQNELFKLKSITEDASDGIDTINDWMYTLEKSKSNISTDIQETANHIKGLIDCWVERMEKRTVELADERRNQVQIKLDNLTSEMKRLKAGHQSARDKLRLAMEKDNILNMSSEISGQISKLCSSATYDSSQLPPPVKFSLTVLADDTTASRLNHFLGDVTCGGGGRIVAESTSSLLSESNLAQAAVPTVWSFRPVKGNMIGMCFTRGNDFFCIDGEEMVVLHYSVGKNYRFNFKGVFGNDVLKDPIDIVQHPDNRILVTDGEFGHSIKALRFELGKWLPCGNIAHAILKKAVGIAVAPDGKIYVSDVDNQCVIRLEAERGDKFQVDMTVQMFKGKYQFEEPIYLAVSQKSGNFVVSDKSGCQIKMFSSTGKFLWRYGGSGNGARNLNKPGGICIDSEDRVYVADVRNKRVHVLSGEGQLIAHIPFKILGKFYPAPDLLDITPKGDLAFGNNKGMLKILQLKF